MEGIRGRGGTGRKETGKEEGTGEESGEEESGEKRSGGKGCRPHNQSRRLQRKRACPVKHQMHKQNGLQVKAGEQVWTPPGEQRPRLTSLSSKA